MILLILLLLSGGIIFSFYSLVLCTEVEICSPFDISQTCSIDRVLPEGLNLQKDCRISGFTKTIFKTDNFIIKSFRNGEFINEKPFTLSVVEKLTHCSYGVDSESAVFHENVTSSLPSPKCNTEVEKCYSENELPSFLRLSEDGSLVVSNGRRGIYEVNVICVNKVSEYKMKLKIEILEKPPKNEVNEKEEKRRNLQSNIITNTWEYSDIKMPVDMWMVSKDKENWIESNSFPPKSVITRRYRNSFSISNIEETGPPVLRMTYDDGIIIYINGKEIFRRNLPVEIIDSETTAIQGGKRNEEISIPFTSIKNGFNYIGIEIRSYRSNPVNVVDSLTCLLSLTDKVSYINQISTALTVSHSYVTPSGKYAKEVRNPDYIYSIDTDYIEYDLLGYLESHKEAEWFPFNITYKFIGNKAYYFNHFSISGCSNDDEYHPKHIKLYAATDSDHPNWELLYENTDLLLEKTKCKTISSYSLPVEKSYESYKMEIVKINEFADFLSVLIKFKLFVTNVKYLPICKEDSLGFPSAYAGGTSFLECHTGYITRKCKDYGSSSYGYWSDEIDRSNCYNENIYVSTYPNVKKLYSFNKDISSITPNSDYVTIKSNILTVNSDIDLVKKFEVTLSDSTIKNVYVTVLRNVGKCSYGVDYIRIYPVEVNLELKCENKIKPPYILVKHLPKGLSADENGVISGMISDELDNIYYTTTITYIIDKKYEIEIKWYAQQFSEMVKGLEFEYFGVSGQDGMNDNGNNFQSSKLKDIWKKFDNGSYILNDEPIVIKKTDISISDANGNCNNPLFKPCQNGIARMKGYIKIIEEGEYTFSGQSERQKFALRNYENELYNTEGYYDEGSYKIKLKRGYYVIGYLTWYGIKSNSFQAYIKKTGGLKTLLNDRIYNGGFILSHLSYNTLFVEMRSNDHVVLKPSYDGIITGWEVSPKIEGLSISVDGTINMTIWKLENNYEVIVVKSKSYLDLCQTSAEFQLHVWYLSFLDIPSNGLKVRYYYLDSIDIENSINVSKIEDKHFVIERIETEFYHEESDNLWTGLPEELSYSFVAEYSGYLFIDTTVSGDMVISLECYDYCKLIIGEYNIECKGSGYHKESLQMHLDFDYHEMKLIYAKGSRDKRKQLKMYYVKEGEIEKEIPLSLYYFNPEYPILYNPSETHYYQNTIIEIKSPMKSALFKKDIVDASYSISPSLPEGISLNDKDGSITGNSELLDENRNYTIRIDLKDGSHYYSSFSFSILAKIEPIVEYPISEISEIVGKDIRISPSSMRCDYINAVGLPDGISISKNGIIEGCSENVFDKIIEIDCYTYKTKSVNIHMRIISDKTLAPTTAEPTTEKPTTVKPSTVKPTTVKPTTDKPTTEEPATEKPTTVKPTTIKPTTVRPTTIKPTTEKPTTVKPTTEKPTTEKPTTEKPTTEKPTTVKPTTIKPTTIRPTTAIPPTTIKPTTIEPTTIPPTTEKPTTEKPTTAIPPTTIKPTTIKPTTSKPTSINPTEKMIELHFYIKISINAITPKDLDIIKESIMSILEKEIDMSISEVNVEMMRNGMRLLSEYNLKVTIKTMEKESDKTDSVIKHLCENEKELESEIKSRCDENSELFNSNIGISTDKNDSIPPEDESGGSSSVIIIVIVVIIIIIIIVLGVVCLTKHHKIIKRSNMKNGNEKGINGKTKIKLRL